MNIEELRRYKAKKIAEIDYLFKGIYFENVGKKHEIIIENIALDKKIINIDFINTNKTCRTLTEQTILEIKALYRELDEIYLNLDMTSSKEEIDKEVDKFIEKVMLELNKLRDTVIDDFHRRSNIKINAASHVNSSLDSFTLKLGSKSYKWKDYIQQIKNQTEQKSKEENTDDKVINDIRLIIMYIYSLPNRRIEKLNKLKELQEIGRYFDESSKEYHTFMNLYFSLRRSTDPNKIEEMYEEAKKLIPIKHR